MKTKWDETKLATTRRRMCSFTSLNLPVYTIQAQGGNVEANQNQMLSGFMYVYNQIAGVEQCPGSR